MATRGNYTKGKAKAISSTSKNKTVKPNPAPQISKEIPVEIKFDPENCEMTAALDIGTSFSGYAFSFKSSADVVMINKNWGAELGSSSSKTPTSLLIDHKGSFVSFGHKAELKYAQFCDNGESHNYHLFRNFKMLLYQEKNLSRKTRIESISGEKHSALAVFTQTIKFLKDHLLEALEKQQAGKPQSHHIQWVLTIPAIWTDQAKQFMREAAFQAGLMTSKESPQLMFALEPEAAAVLCRQIDVREFSEVTTEQVNISFEPGNKYMLIDAGGGTVDITAHEITPSGDMIELMCATGGNWGGSRVDHNFQQTLSELLGADFINQFKTRHPQQWLSLMFDFEKKKRACNLGEKSHIGLPLSWALCELYEDLNQKSIDKDIIGRKMKGITFQQGSVIFSSDIVQQFFLEPVDKIIFNVKEILKRVQNLSKLNYILLVGGFGDSKFLYSHLKSEFHRVCPVLCPHSAGLSVVKGAVMFAQKPQVITARRARHTYGAGCGKPFIEGVHKEDKMYIDEKGEKWCRDLFRTFVTKDELIEVNSCKTLYYDRVSLPSDRKATDTSDLVHTTVFYMTDRDKVMYTDDPGVTPVGEIKCTLPYVPGVEWGDRKCEYRMYFGQTEIKVEMKDLTTGKVFEGSIDFLGIKSW